MNTYSVKNKARVAKHEIQILKKICQELDTPRSLTVYLLVHYGELAQYMKLDIDPFHYNNAAAFSDDYLVTEMLKKSKALELGINLEQVAFEKWVSAELQCSNTNERINSWKNGLITPIKPHIGTIIARAIELLQSWSGRLTASSLNFIDESMEFGPGSTASVKKLITRGKKYQNPHITTSQHLLSFGLFCMPHLWKNEVKHFEIQDYNSLSFVPKNAKTHRAITVETDLNIYVQKGIGKLLKLKLKNQGIDTATQETINQNLASRASREDLATIDLSSASDTISYELVKLFFSPDWFELLSWARPEKTKYQGKEITLSKFSGMGNGFTFEMETMIFYSILASCKELARSTRPIATYGDDMICGNDIASDVIDTLSFLGLSVNHEKTHGISLFHESCGADYFDSLNVRPFHLKFGKNDFNDEEKICLYLYANNIRRYASHRNGGYTCDSRFLPAWLYCYSRLTKDDRRFVPDFGYEAQGLVGNFDEARPSRYKRKDGWVGWSFTGFTRKPKRTAKYRRGAYIASLSQMSDFTQGREAIRGETFDGTFERFYSLNWIELGPWL